MPELQWTELDFIECLEVVPEVGEYKERYLWNVVQDRLTLSIAMWPWESVLELSLLDAAASSPIVEFAVVVRGSIERKEPYGRFEHLRLHDCIIVPSRFYALEVGDVFDRAEFPYGLTIEIAVKPQISVSVAA